MNEVTTACLVIVGLINFLPVAGVVSSAKLERAYAVSLASNDLQILMRHRALLFGVLGGFILYSAFCPVYQVAAMTMGAVSMVGYVVLARLVGGHNDSLAKVLVAVLVGIGFLLAEILLKVSSPS